ncbi:hypothetical protein G1K46_12205 [Tenacibaculum finnmarkense]|uniref:hypothetical protein n=1 Tax=Tenacibaculum finnmarkense TaxID=2781243 RepID=UPI001EFB9764|nr:hypothetical protein [Tenacibaculum finnmarkense]MCG8763481.1 hypothetical protein [Tenacibaculum finnmarkense]MCG8788914.1 hypothetical protein [Tenacibaculum finnmarkense]
MELSKKQKKGLAGLITAFANNSFKNGILEVDSENKAYYNLISELYKIEEIKAIYDEDIAIHGITQGLESIIKYDPIICEEKDVNSIIKSVIDTLNNNLSDHLIIIPIPNSQFKEKISFRNYTFIPQEYSKKEKIKIVNRLTRGKLENTTWFANHTESSRSSHFWEYPLFCLKQKQQTKFVHYNSENIIKTILYALQCFYYGKIKGTDNDKTSMLIRAKTRMLKKPSHLAVYSKENWRQHHRPLSFEIDMPFDLSWLNEPKFKRGFNKFLKCIYLKEKLDDLDLRFLNGMFLFSESLSQNASISTILLLTIAESVLTQGKNEKRLRLSAILPKLISKSTSEQKEYSRLLSELYTKRNNFVHSGEKITLTYDADFNKDDSVEKLRMLIARLILNYSNIEKTINKGNRAQMWDNRVNNMFNEIIFG